MRKMSSVFKPKLPALHDRDHLNSIIYIYENCVFESNTRKLAFTIEINFSCAQTQLKTFVF